jgi:hypothetical protein
MELRELTIEDLPKIRREWTAETEKEMITSASELAGILKKKWLKTPNKLINEIIRGSLAEGTDYTVKRNQAICMTLFISTEWVQKLLVAINARIKALDIE